MISLKDYVDFIYDNAFFLRYKEMKEILSSFGEIYYEGKKYVSIEEIINEHLKNIDPKWILSDLKEYFYKASDIQYDKKSKLVMFLYKDNPKIDEDIKQLCNIYQYNIKYCYFDRMNEVYVVHLDPRYPKQIDTANKLFFHVVKNNKKIVDRILQSGLRPKYNRHEKQSGWKAYKSNAKNEQFCKSYMFYVNGPLDNESLHNAKRLAQQVIDEITDKNEDKNDYALLQIDIPQHIPIYNDDSMKSKNCVFSYVQIPSKCISKIKFKYSQKY